jgi:hypothetical protein
MLVSTYFIKLVVQIIRRSPAGMRDSCAFEPKWRVSNLESREYRMSDLLH